MRPYCGITIYRPTLDHVRINLIGGHEMITLEKVAAIVAEQRRDTAYQVVLQAQRELKRFEHEYVAALKAVECST